MEKEIKNFVFSSTLQNLKIEVTEITDSAIIGAATLPVNKNVF